MLHQILRSPGVNSNEILLKGAVFLAPEFRIARANKHPAGTRRDAGGLQHLGGDHIHVIAQMNHVGAPPQYLQRRGRPPLGYSIFGERRAGNRWNWRGTLSSSKMRSAAK